MYICICKGITDKMLSEHLGKNSHPEKDIMKNLGIGDSCGACIIDCVKKIQESLHISDSQTQHSDS